MKKALVPLVLTLALGLAACGKSEDATNTLGGDNVVLNDEDAADIDNVAAVDPLSNGAPGDELNNIAITGSNTTLGNTL